MLEGLDLKVRAVVWGLYDKHHLYSENPKENVVQDSMLLPAPSLNPKPRTLMSPSQGGLVSGRGSSGEVKRKSPGFRVQP